MMIDHSLKSRILALYNKANIKTVLCTSKNDLNTVVIH